MTPLERAAFAVAIAAPTRPNDHVFAAKIPWHLIHELRVELGRRGFDWQGALADRDRRTSERNEAAHQAAAAALLVRQAEPHAYLYPMFGPDPENPLCESCQLPEAAEVHQ